MAEPKQRLIAEFEKSGAEVVRVHLVEWKAQTYVDVRVWYRGDDGTIHPSTKGIRLNVELLDDLITALGKAQAELEGGVEIVQDDGQEAEKA